MAELASTILIVDDNSTNLQLLHGTLAPLGHRILAATSGAKAIELAHQQQPDVILLDIMMPVMDGYEVCRRLKQDVICQHIPIIFLSALDDTADKVKGLEAGAVDYVTKPFQPAEVVARVTSQLKIRHLEKSLMEKNAALQEINERMQKDLNAAARVQQSLLPADDMHIEGVEFSWQFQPCKFLAGDALNFFSLDDEHVAMYVLDVSGHGVASSLLSVAVTRALSRLKIPGIRLFDNDKDMQDGKYVRPDKVATTLNTLFPMADNGQHFFTLVYGVLNTQTRVFDFVTCGHPGPIVVNTTSESSMHSSPSLPVGIVAGAEYQSQQLQLNQGDTLFLYSDGVSEQRNGKDEQFGTDAMVTAFVEAAPKSLAHGTAAIINALGKWGDDSQFSDDVTLLAFRLP